MSQYWKTLHTSNMFSVIYNYASKSWEKTQMWDDEEVDDDDDDNSYHDKDTKPLFWWKKNVWIHIIFLLLYKPVWKEQHMETKLMSAAHI